MGNSFYHYLAFIHPENNITIKEVNTVLEAFYVGKKEKPKIVLSKNNLVLKFNDYKFYISLSDGKHVVEEAKEIAENRDFDWLDKQFDKEKLAQCLSRFEIFGDEDFDMDYFNDSLIIMETIEKLNGLTIFETN